MSRIISSLETIFSSVEDNCRWALGAGGPGLRSGLAPDVELVGLEDEIGASLPVSDELPRSAVPRSRTPSTSSTTSGRPLGPAGHRPDREISTCSRVRPATAPDNRGEDVRRSRYSPSGASVMSTCHESRRRAPPGRHGHVGPSAPDRRRPARPRHLPARPSTRAAPHGVAAAPPGRAGLMWTGSVPSILRLRIG